MKRSSRIIAWISIVFAALWIHSILTGVWTAFPEFAVFPLLIAMLGGFVAAGVIALLCAAALLKQRAWGWFGLLIAIAVRIFWQYNEFILSGGRIEHLLLVGTFGLMFWLLFTDKPHTWITKPAASTSEARSFVSGVRQITGGIASLVGFLMLFVSGSAGFVLCLGVLNEIAGLWAIVVGFTVLPATFVAVPWYAGFQYGNWDLLLLCYLGPLIGCGLVALGTWIQDA